MIMFLEGMAERLKLNYYLSFFGHKADFPLPKERKCIKSYSALDKRSHHQFMAILEDL